MAQNLAEDVVRKVVETTIEVLEVEAYADLNGMVMNDDEIKERVVEILCRGGAPVNTHVGDDKI